MLINLLVSLPLALAWFIALGVFVAGFYIALRSSKTDPRIYASLINIPKFISFQILALLKAGKANQISVATQHGQSDKSKL